MSSTVSVLLLVAAAIVGLIYCFRGYRYLKFFMMVFGVYLGYTLVTDYFTPQAELFGGWLWLIALAVGLILAALAYFFLKFTFFLAGGLVGLLIYNLIRLSNPVFFSELSGGMTLLLGAILFLVFGIIMVVTKKYLIIVGTACYGSYLFVDAVGALLGMAILERPAPSLSLMAMPALASGTTIFSELAPWIPWTIVIVLAIAGIVTQYRKNRGKK